MSTSDTRIVVGFDASDDALAALRFGAREALAREAQLRLVFAIDDTVLNSAWGIVFDVEAVRAGGEQVLAEARNVALGLGLADEAIVTETVVGQPAAAIRRAAEGAALVVVGRRSESGTQSMFVGSTAVGLVQAASCPVVVTSALNVADHPTDTIAVGLDPGAHGIAAVEWALKRASRLGTRVRVLTVVKKPQSRLFARGAVTDDQAATAIEGVRKRLQAAIDELVARVGDGVEVDLDVRYGSPIDELVAASKQQEMMIVGVHPAFPTYALGGVVRGLMAHAGCTLGIVRHQ